MESSPFNNLSAELRNQVYTVALCPAEGFTLEVGGERLSLMEPCVNLLATCRQVHSEAAGLLDSFLENRTSLRVLVPAFPVVECDSKDFQTGPESGRNQRWYDLTRAWLQRTYGDQMVMTKFHTVDLDLRSCAGFGLRGELDCLAFRTSDSLTATQVGTLATFLETQGIATTITVQISPLSCDGNDSLGPSIVTLPIIEHHAVMRSALDSALATERSRIREAREGRTITMVDFSLRHGGIATSRRCLQALITDIDGRWSDFKRRAIQDAAKLRSA